MLPQILLVILRKVRGLLDVDKDDAESEDEGFETESQTLEASRNVPSL